MPIIDSTSIEHEPTLAIGARYASGYVSGIVSRSAALKDAFSQARVSFIQEFHRDPQYDNCVLLAKWQGEHLGLTIYENPEEGVKLL